MRLAGCKVREATYVSSPLTDLLLEKLRYSQGNPMEHQDRSTLHGDVEGTATEQMGNLTIILLFNNEPQFGCVDKVKP